MVKDYFLRALPPTPMEFRQLYVALDADLLEEPKQNFANGKELQNFPPNKDSFNIPGVHYDVPLRSYSSNEFKEQIMYAFLRRPRPYS